MGKLEEEREKIDEIDYKIIDLLIERKKILPEIIAAKAAAGIGTEDLDREETMVHDRIRHSKNEFKETFIRSFFALIFKESKRIQDEISKTKE